MEIDSLGGAADGANLGTVAWPWKTALKAFASAAPGDNAIVRRDACLLPRTVLTADFKLDPVTASPITY